MTIEKQGAKRIAQIDGLRGVAACLVLGFHLTARFDKEYHHLQHLPIALPWGYLGVNLFFAISGFVILMTLRSVRAPMDFVVSRFARLYPTYWACMLVTAAVLVLFPLPHHVITLGEVAGNFLMFQGLVGIDSVDGAYWSLEVELIFYLIMLLCWTVGALKRPLPPLALWVALSMLSKFLPTPWVVSHMLLLDWIPWFAIGISIFLFAGRHEDHRWAPALLVLALIAIGQSQGLWLVAWGVAVSVLMYTAATDTLKLASTKPLLFLGAISYPLYLLHEYLSYTFMLRVEAHGLPSYVAVLLAVFGSIGLAYAVHRIVEKPAAAWVRRTYNKRTEPGNLKLWRAGLVSVFALLVLGTRLIG